MTWSRLGQLPGAVRRHSEAVLLAILGGTLMRQGWSVDYAPDACASTAATPRSIRVRSSRECASLS